MAELACGYPCEVTTPNAPTFHAVPYTQVLAGMEVVDVFKGTVEFTPLPPPSAE